MPELFRLAHISDLHLAVAPAFSQLNPKRILGRLNWLFNRRFFHLPVRLEQAVGMLLRERPHAVLVTGDLGQLGLPEEISRAASFLEQLTTQGVPVLVASGNHDHYGVDPESAARFARVRDALRLDVAIDEVGVATVKGVEIVMLNQARPTAIFQAWGEVGATALAGLRERLADPPENGLRLAAGHYPLCLSGGRRLPSSHALRDAEAVREIFRASGIRAYFCGHVHRPYQLELFPGCWQYCAGSITGRGRLAYYVCGGGEVRAERSLTSMGG